ncbi:MAG: YidC/Oxa1 family membrane protein insertase [Acidimicrobiales bacterium]
MFQFLAGVLAYFYSLIPNYAVAIALLTLSVMLVLSPLTLKSTRSMLAMQKLQPEMKALQTKHKGGDRQKLNEEMMALYKEHKVNPVAGCLPMIMQMPVFLVMYNVISGLTKKTGEVASPKYLDEKSDLFQALRASGGRMKSFGIDLAQSASDKHSSFTRALPFFLIVAFVVFTQYIQTRQTMARNTKAASPQQQIILKVMPAFFGLISLSIPAAVNVYFLVSALFRIGQTAAMYRFDPALSAHAEKHAREIEAKVTEVRKDPKGGGKRPPASSGATDRKPVGKGGGGGATGKASGNGTKPGSNRAGQPKNGRRPPPRPPQNRRSKKGR